MIKRILVIAAVFLLINVTDTQAASLEDSLTFKVTIIEGNVEYEWEYNNPDEFEYEHGETVVKDGQARREVMKMFRYLNVSPDAEVEKMVTRLKKDGHDTIERLEVRWINSNEKLYTWVWHKKK
ncbi:MAG TPA: hypothetical protein VFT51_03415 [Bacillales bacterium]|nr:hypothetical protein [Bacillales bacterium]